MHTSIGLLLSLPFLLATSVLAQETGSQETGSQETGSQETGSQETGSQETGSQETGSQETGSLQHRDVRLLDVSGTPHQRGLTHGRELKAEIVEIIGDFKADLTRSQGLPADEFIAAFLEMTDFIPAIEEWTPGLLDEVRGIAEGAGLPFEDVYVFQLADEIWSMGRWALREKCTAIAVNKRAEQPTIVAQNMDIPGFYQKFPMLLRVREDAGSDKPDTLVFTCPGLIGVNGMNSDAVAVACNTLLQLRPSLQGLPCLFIVRGVLRQRSRAEAEEWLTSIPHAVGQNYTIGDPTSAMALECSAGDQVQFTPDPEGDFTYHTNHPLVSRDWHPDYLARCEKRGRKAQDGLYVCQRFEALQERIRSGAEITPDTIVSALASRDHARGPICGDWNYGCTLFMLRDEPQLLLAPGRPDQVAFQSFGF